MLSGRSWANGPRIPIGRTAMSLQVTEGGAVDYVPTWVIFELLGASLRAGA